MKLVTAIVRNDKVDHVKEALKAAGARGMTVSPTHGFGTQQGKAGTWRGADYVDDMNAKTEVRVVVSDDQLPKVLGAIVYGGRTGEIGDGKVWVTPVDQVIRIRTGDVDEAAIEPGSGP